MQVMKKLSKAFFYLLSIIFFTQSIFFFSSKAFASFSLKERFEKAEKGDFIVTLEKGTFTLLAIQDISEGKEKLSLAEISIPQNLVDRKTFSWKSWVEKEVLKSISYNIYEIDLKNCSLVRSYSVTNNTFFSISSQDNFFTKLLTLPLEYLPDQKRKKIGPPPLDNSFDTRALWNPPQIIDGTRRKKPGFMVYRATWPKDGSELSGKVIDLYFDNEGFIPFPYWIQISNGNIEVMLKIVDSGKNIKCEKKPPN